MEHIRLIDVLRSVILWGIALDVVVWAVWDAVRALEDRAQRRASRVGALQWGLLAAGLVLGSLAMWAIALGAPIAWSAGLVVALAAVEGVAVIGKIGMAHG